MIPANQLDLKEGVSYIKQLRLLLGLSRESFAAKLGTTSNTIYRWEAGVHTCSMTSSQWKRFYTEVLIPLEISILDLPEDLGAPYVKAA